MKLPNGQFLFPTANPATGLVSLSEPADFNENQYMGNFDYIQSQKNTVQGRFFTALSNTTNPFGLVRRKSAGHSFDEQPELSGGLADRQLHIHTKPLQPG